MGFAVPLKLRFYEVIMNKNTKHLFTHTVIPAVILVSIIIYLILFWQK